MDILARELAAWLLGGGLAAVAAAAAAAAAAVVIVVVVEEKIRNINPGSSTIQKIPISYHF